MSKTPNGLGPGMDVGVTESLIHELVITFYARVRYDEVLGPIFNAAIEGWDEHHETLCRFWSSVTLMTGRYKGTPMQVHATLTGISATHFDHWLDIFRQTAREVCAPLAADLFIDRAERIAESLELGIAIQRGHKLGPGERLAAD